MTSTTSTNLRKKSILDIFKRAQTQNDHIEKRPSFWNKVARSASMIFNQQQKLQASEGNTPEHTTTSGLNSSNNGDSDSDEDTAEVIVEKGRFNVGSLTQQDYKILQDDLSALGEDFFGEEVEEEEEELDNTKFSKTATSLPKIKSEDNLRLSGIKEEAELESLRKRSLSIQNGVKRKDSLSNIIHKNKLNSEKRIRTFSEIKQNGTDEEKKEEKKNKSEGKINRNNSFTTSQTGKERKSISKTNSFINSTLVRIDSFKITFDQEDEENEGLEEDIEEVDETSSFLYSFSKKEFLKFFSREGGFLDAKIGLRTKSRMVIKKKKFMTVFSAIDVVSWLFANPEFFGKKKIKVSDCVLFGKMLEKLGIIENVSNRKKFEDVDNYYVFTQKLQDQNLFVKYQEECAAFFESQVEKEKE